MIRIVNSFFLIEFLYNIVDKISIFLQILLSKRRLSRLPKPYATERNLPIVDNLPVANNFVFGADLWDNHEINQKHQ